MALLRGYRLRRGPALALLVLVGVVGSAVILATQLRPSLEVYDAVRVEDAAVGTTYAVDEQLCLRTAQVSARVDRVRVDGDPDALALEVALPPDDRPPVIAFPVAPDAAAPLEGAVVPARDVLCLRLLLRPEEQGVLAAPEVAVRVRYGPFGVFRRTFTPRPPTTVEADRTGQDPRLAGS